MCDVRQARNMKHLAQRMVRTWICAGAFALCSALASRAADVSTSPAYFEKSIRPLFKDYCLTCHSTEKQ